MKAYYRPMVLSDFIEVTSMRLRQADIEEVEAATGLGWQTALLNAVRCSTHTWVIIYDNRIEGVFGLGEYGPTVGVPWLLATNRFASFSYRLARQSGEVVELMLGLYPTLTNRVYAKHRDAIRWLKWLGFKFKDEYVYLKDRDVPFIPFVLRRNEYVRTHHDHDGDHGHHGGRVDGDELHADTEPERPCRSGDSLNHSSRPG